MKTLLVSAKNHIPVFKVMSALLSWALFMTLLSSCGNSSKAHVDGEKQGNAHSSASHTDEIVLSEVQARAAGIRIEAVKAGGFNGVVKTSGRILSASGDETTVVATAAGIVSLTRSVTDGMAVGSGTAVFAISSSGLQDGDVSQRADIAWQTAKAEYERARKLVADKIISEKDFLAIKADYENARLAYSSVVKTNGAKGIVVKVPKGGYVKECLVKDGDYVTVGQPLMVLSRNKNIYLRAEVAERDYDMLNKITSAKFRLSYSDRLYDLKALNGRLVSYGKTSAASTFIPVTFEFANTGGIIPGAFAEIYLITDKRPNVITVPVTALTEEQGIYFVYLQTDAECYRKQEVTIGMSDGARTEVLSGLKGGERLVAEGAIHVKLAAASKSIPGHTHSH